MSTYKSDSEDIVLLQEFQSWIDEYGLITDVHNGGPSGNGILYTAHYALGLKTKGLLSEKERQRIINAIEMTFDLPGLIDRSVAKELDYEAHDDYIGLLLLSLILDKPEWAKNVLLHGKNTFCNGIDESEIDTKKAKYNRLIFPILKIIKCGKVNWVWNNRNYDKFHASSWLGRRLEVTATMKMAAKESVNVFQWIYWAIYMISLSKNSSDDAYILRFYMSLICEKHGFVTKLVCNYVKNKIKKDFGDFGKLLFDYFKNPSNPLPKLLDGVG